MPKDEYGVLFRWVAVLTGSKNTLKGIGFFMGGALLAWLGFAGALIAMAGGLAAGALEHWPYRPRVRAVLAVTLALAVYYAALPLMASVPPRS